VQSAYGWSPIPATPRAAPQRRARTIRIHEEHEMIVRMGSMTCAALCVGLALVASVAGAQQSAGAYPTKPIRLVVPLAPGGANDLVARALGQKLSESLKQAVVVENRAGAGGVIGTDFVAKSSPDGYTLLLAQTTVPVNASLIPKLPYDTLRDLQAISLLTRAPYLLAVHPSLPVQTFRQLAAFAKARPGQLNHASAGSATGGHLAMEVLMERTGMKLTQITYKGGGPALIDFIAGQTQVCLTNISTLMPQVKAGKARALATSGIQRAKAAPDLPTIAESGVPGFNEGAFNGVMAPSGVPKPIIEKLHAEIVKAMHSPDVLNRFAQEGLEVVTSTPDEFAQMIRDDVAKWAKVIKRAGIRLD
jgi:tripartite-type tricarboxylate transporter receptor subunit TctC